jgi:anthranilate synthase/aminodeoxychorismate synthase-like glutamine amidotransferase
VQYFETLNTSVTVYSNDDITLQEIEQLAPKYIVISPGPGRPEAAGITLSLIKHFAGKIPMLGICLGHQAIAMAYGAKIILAEKVMHGKTSAIYHHQQNLFCDIKNPFNATRYHSLIIDPHSLTNEFEITAWTKKMDGSLHEIMAISHQHYALYGVQFHPESILSECGHQLLANFLQASKIRAMTSENVKSNMLMLS